MYVKEVTETKIMKKILLVLAVILSAFAASAQKIATVTNESLTRGKASGVYVFTLPADITAAQVKDSENYYTQYFKVNYDEGKHLATITMVQDDAKARHVIERFMVSLQIRTFKMGENDYTFKELYDQYLR